MAELAERTAKTAAESANLGRADRPDVLAAQVEVQRSQLGVTLATQKLERTWREIAALTAEAAWIKAHPELDGDLEALPMMNGEAMQNIYANNPTIKAAQFSTNAAMLSVDRARVEKIPDVMLRGGVRNNRELIAPGSEIGREGFFDIGVQLPLFNRNQGALAAARAEAEHARLETDRLRMAYAQRFALVLNDFQNANSTVKRYHDEMIPAATEAFELYLDNFGKMTATHMQVLATQRSLIQLQEDYVAALLNAWRAVVEIDTLLERN